jgi:pyrroline-5-carboxylate reductase
MTIKGRTIGFIGGGNMGEALIKGLLGASLVPASAIGFTGSRSRPTTASWCATPTS